MLFFYYFAYGSNLLTERIEVQNKGSEYLCNGVLNDFRLDFVSYAPRWHGGIATITEEEQSNVIGVVWKIPMNISHELDKQESGYHRLTVPVKCDSAEIFDCRTYQYSNPAAAKSHPSPHYKTVIVAGAIEHNLPSHYVKKLQEIQDNGYKGHVMVNLDAIKHLNDDKATTKGKDKL